MNLQINSSQCQAEDCDVAEVSEPVCFLPLSTRFLLRSGTSQDPTQSETLNCKFPKKNISCPTKPFSKAKKQRHMALVLKQPAAASNHESGWTPKIQHQHDNENDESLHFKTICCLLSWRELGIRLDFRSIMCCACL